MITAVFNLFFFISAAAVEEVKLKDTQYTLEHMRAFGMYNYLHLDPWYEDSVYFVDCKGRVLNLTVTLVSLQILLFFGVIFGSLYSSACLWLLPLHWCLRCFHTCTIFYVMMHIVPHTNMVIVLAVFPMQKDTKQTKTQVCKVIKWSGREHQGWKHHKRAITDLNKKSLIFIKLAPSANIFLNF